LSLDHFGFDEKNRGKISLGLHFGSRMLCKCDLSSEHIFIILLIEDNRVIAQQIIEFLSSHNWQTWDSVV
jgi:hypothetical protein